MKVFIKTFGCQSNIADSEVIAGILSKDFEIVKDIKKADIIIVNSCGVKNKTQNKITKYIQDLPKTKKVFVGGCLPRMFDLKKLVPNVSGFFDVNSITKIKELIKDKKEIFSDKKENLILKSVIRKDKIGRINISKGCLGNCSYCSVKFVRGKLKSYKEEDIIKSIKRALKDDCKLIYLSSQDNSCYGKDIGTNLVNLLKKVVQIKGDFKVRVGMMNPQHILSFLDELVEVYKNDKILKFIHIPIESGSDKVLKEMNRGYKIKDFKKIVKKFRKIPKMNIATDIIVGFPLEKKEDFNQTLKLIRKINPEVLNISKFGPRPKTKASKLKQLKTQIIKERSRKLSKEFKKLKK